MSHRHDTAHGWTYTRTVQIASHTSVNDIDTSDTTDYYLGAFEGYSAEMTYCAELPLAQKVSPNHDLLRKAAKPQSRKARLIWTYPRTCPHPSVPMAAIKAAMRWNATELSGTEQP